MYFVLMRQIQKRFVRKGLADVSPQGQNFVQKYCKLNGLKAT
jgi:hypothetical protein